jgi:polyisoprenoid-binding protein YceI
MNAFQPQEKTMRPALATLLTLAAFAAACNALPSPTSAPTAAAAPATVEQTPSPEPTASPGEAPAATPTEAPDQPDATGASTTFVIVPEETTASYSIDEVFINENNRLNTAVGVTSVVEGQFTLNRADPAASDFGEFTVDISTLQSDSNRRDNRIRQEWLESARFPIATFVVKEVRNFPPNPQEDQPMLFQLVGDLTLKETTREVTWDVTAMLSDDRLTGVAKTFILLEDFNIPVPNIVGILRVTDGATVTLKFVFRAAP